MAIQLPNPGLGDGQTGDNEFVMWTKVKDNFSNNTHAASRLVGSATGNLVQVGFNGIGAYWDRRTLTNTSFNPESLQGTGMSLSLERDALSPYGSQNSYIALNLMSWSTSDSKFLNSRVIFRDTEVYIQSPNGTEWGTASKIYHSGNTTTDAGTGFLKVSSPVLHVYNDKIDKIHEAEQLDITVDKKGVGHYEIHGTTGLRQNDGWNMSPPRDIHGNVRCMIEVTENDDVITVKTYKRKFDLELAAIVHDYDNPLDIPAGACVELRFNDLPYESLDDTQTEV